MPWRTDGVLRDHPLSSFLLYKHLCRVYGTHILSSIGRACIIDNASIGDLQSIDVQLSLSPPEIMQAHLAWMFLPSATGAPRRQVVVVKRPNDPNNPASRAQLGEEQNFMGLVQERNGVCKNVLASIGTQARVIFRETNTIYVEEVEAVVMPHCETDLMKVRRLTPWFRCDSALAISVCLLFNQSHLNFDRWVCEHRQCQFERLLGVHK